jgi:hypothetical protein
MRQEMRTVSQHQEETCRIWTLKGKLPSGKHERTYFSRLAPARFDRADISLCARAAADERLSMVSHDYDVVAKYST